MVLQAQEGGTRARAEEFRVQPQRCGQIPTGWHAGRYGIPDDIIAQADRSTLWAPVCTAEALNMSGITDPYALYKHIHPSEVGTSLGSGMSGTVSLAKMFKDRRDEKEVQNDILQETYVTSGCFRRITECSWFQFHQYYGWLDQLASHVSSGPVKIPVGAWLV